MKIHRSPISIFLVVAIAVLSSISCKPNTRKDIATSTKKFEIPFKLIGNVIILPVKVDGSRELRVILDTGMSFEGLLLYDKDLKDSIALENAIEVLVPGAGSDSGSNAIMADSLSFFVDTLECKNQKIIILQNDRMQGMSSEGVTGYSLFGNYIVEVDYDRMVIILHGSRIEVDSSWECLPLTFKEHKIPWIVAAVSIGGAEDTEISCYIDLASGDALELLIKENMKFRLPEKLEDAYLGTGLSGDIYGQRGRIHALKLGSFYLRDVTTSFAPVEIRSKLDDADGVIGNNSLRRFNVIFDYQGGRLYLKPNSYFNEPF
jgi:hypothetical protein